MRRHRRPRTASALEPLRVPGAFRATGDAPTALAGAGTVYVQDQGSQMIAHLAARDGRVLDACAAPGGKATLLADLGGGRATVMAADASRRRVRTLAALARRWGAAGRARAGRGRASSALHRGRSIPSSSTRPAAASGRSGATPTSAGASRADDLPRHAARQRAMLDALAAARGPGRDARLRDLQPRARGKRRRGRAVPRRPSRVPAGTAARTGRRPSPPARSRGRCPSVTAATASSRRGWCAREHSDGRRAAKGSWYASASRHPGARRGERLGHQALRHPPPQVRAPRRGAGHHRRAERAHDDEGGPEVPGSVGSVPRGRRVPDAGNVAARSKLLLRVDGKRNDPRMPADLIVEQDPPAGALLKTQRSVRVWVSLGPRRLTVPSVEGESLRSGRLTLEQAGVNVGRVLEVTNAAEEGTILLQRPPAGETDKLAEEGASLLVSRGPRQSRLRDARPHRQARRPGAHLAARGGAERDRRQLQALSRRRARHRAAPDPALRISRHAAGGRSPST